MIAETDAPHEIASDGYCFTCKQVPCAAGRPRTPRQMSQLDRIEAKLNKLLRVAGVEVE